MSDSPPSPQLAASSAAEQVSPAWTFVAWLPYMLLQVFAIFYLRYASLDIVAAQRVGSWTAVLATLIVGTALLFFVFFLTRSLRYTVHTILAVTLVWSGSLAAIGFIANNLVAGLLFLKVFLIAVILIVLSLPSLGYSIHLLRLSAKYALSSSTLVGLVIFFAFFATAFLLAPAFALLASIYHYNHLEVDSNLSDSYGWNVTFIVLFSVLAVAVLIVTRYVVHYAAAYVFSRKFAGNAAFVASASSDSAALIPASSKGQQRDPDLSDDFQDRNGEATFWSTLWATFGSGFWVVFTASIVMLPNSIAMHIYHRLSLIARDTFHPLYVARARAYSVYGVSVAAGGRPGTISLHDASTEAWAQLERRGATALTERSVVASLLLLVTLTIAAAVGALCYAITKAIVDANGLAPSPAPNVAPAYSPWFALVVGALYALLVLWSLLEALEAGAAAIICAYVRDPSVFPDEDRDELGRVMSDAMKEEQ